MEFLAGFSDDQKALLGCLVLLTGSVIIMYLGYLTGKWIRNEDQSEEEPLPSESSLSNGQNVRESFQDSEITFQNQSPPDINSSAKQIFESEQLTDQDSTETDTDLSPSALEVPSISHAA